MKKEPSRFDEILTAAPLGTANGPAGRTGGAGGTGKRVGKFSGAEYGQFSFHMLRKVHADLKSECAREGSDMSEVVGELVAGWLERRGD